MHVGFEDHVQRRRLATLNGFEQIFESSTRTGDGNVSRRANSLCPSFGQRTGLSRVARNTHLVTRVGWFGESQDLHGSGRTGHLHLATLVVHEGLDLAPRGSRHDVVAQLELTLLHHDRRHGTSTNFQIRFENRTGRTALLARGELL